MRQHRYHYFYLQYGHITFRQKEGSTLHYPGETDGNGNEYPPDQYKGAGQIRLEQVGLGCYTRMERDGIPLSISQQGFLNDVTYRCETYINNYTGEAGQFYAVHPEVYQLIKIGVINGCFDDEMNIISADDLTGTAAKFYYLFKSEPVWNETPDGRIAADPFQETFYLMEEGQKAWSEFEESQSYLIGIVDDSGNIVVDYSDSHLQTKIDGLSEDELRKLLRSYITLSFQCPYIPHIAPDDVIRFSNNDLGIDNGLFVVNSVSIPHDPNGMMSLTCSNIDEISEVSSR